MGFKSHSITNMTTAEEHLNTLTGHFYSPYEAQHVAAFARTIKKEQIMNEISVKTGRIQLSIRDANDDQVSVSTMTLNPYSGEYEYSSVLIDNSELLGLFAPSLRLALDHRPTD